MSSPSENPWRIEKRISISDVIKTTLVAAAFFIYLTQMEKDINTNDQQIAFLRDQIKVEKEAREISLMHLKDRMDRSDDRIESMLDEMKESLQRIEDRLYEEKK